MLLIKPFEHFFGKSLLAIGSLFLSFLIFAGLAYIYLEVNLPDVETLKDIHFQEPLRIYSANGKLIEEFGSKRCIPVKIKQVPRIFIKAILATEDQRFFEHPGIDLPGLVRATINILKTGEKSQGASTITMQVARNFFLTRKKTYARKIREILLAIKIDKELSKEKILELYLNKIYFGQGAYGVAAASKTYYNKNLHELSLAQFAMLAGLPQAPSRINPIVNPKAALKRRKHVLNRMLDENAISNKEYLEAIQQPITAKYYNKQIEVHAPHAAELIRKILYQKFGDDLYNSGYKIYCTIQKDKQKYANKSIQNAIENYDKRHGYRGALDNIDTVDAVQWNKYPSSNKYKLAIVTKVESIGIDAQLENSSFIKIDMKNMSWARKNLPNGKIGKAIQHPDEIVKVGDIIHVSQKNNSLWQLDQIPEIEGAFIAINPQNNHIEALVGGYDFSLNSYNHVTQAKRQPGSSFKPFIYAAALEKGYTLADKINDAPIVKKDQSQDSLVWRPKNDNHKFSGLTSLRNGLMLSKNLVSIRLLEALGLDYTRSFVEKFGFSLKDIPNSLSMALGSANVTPLELSAAWGPFANGGKKCSPFLVNKIINAKGEVVYLKEHNVTEEKEQVLSPQVAYLITDVLKNSIYHGNTGRTTRKKINRLDIAGKTGSTNDNKDAWFAGYHKSLVAISWIGFDVPRSIYEYGYKAALPAWLDFMAQVLKQTPESRIPEPKNMLRVRIDPRTSLLASSENDGSFFELFREGNAPTTYTQPEDIDLANMKEYLF
ncbi:MAG: PBP1A family penicillin-binding protein [Legionellales bacterium]|nr:PBP1A family penicillin-binding protein [Legionellales bacterium]